MPTPFDQRLAVARADFERGVNDAHVPENEYATGGPISLETESASYWLGHAEGIRARVAASKAP